MRRSSLAFAWASSLAIALSVSACRRELRPIPAVRAPELQAEDRNAPLIPPGARQYGAAVIRDAHFYWGFGAPVAMFMGQIHQESRWRPDARSPDAAGLTQFTPATAADFTRMYPADLRALCKHQDCRFDPKWAIRAMVLYDRNLDREFALVSAGDETLGFTLAAYNGGAGWLTREARVCDDRPECNSSQYFAGVALMCGKTHPARSAASCRENRNYPAVILFRWRPMYQRWLDAEAIR